MTFTGDLLAGIGQHLAAHTAATWRPAGNYTSADTWPVVIISVPASPDQVITLTPYGVSADFAVNDTVQGIQVRTRGTRDPRPVLAKNDAIFDALHGLAGVTLGGIHVVSVEWQSGSYLGVDTNGRHEHSHNYYVQAARPSTHRTD